MRVVRRIFETRSERPGVGMPFELIVEGSTTGPDYMDGLETRWTETHVRDLADPN